MYTKQQQLANNKEKPQPQFGKKFYKWNNKGYKRITTDDELKYLNWLKRQNIGCLVCNSKDTEIHHIKERSTDKKNHYEVLILCKKHHTGREISPHGNKKEFFRQYPIEYQKTIAKHLLEAYKEQTH